MAMMSACIKWAKEHVDAFNAMLDRQLSSVDRESETWERCMEVVMGRAEVLSEAGLDFRNMVGSRV
jgi:hypothetical protein